MDEALEILNSSSKGNAASIFTTSGGAMRRFRHDAGRDARRQHRRRRADGLLPFPPAGRTRSSATCTPTAPMRSTSTEKKVVITRWPKISLVAAKRFEYAASLGAEGRLLAGGEAPLIPGKPWTPEHLVLAGLMRCTLKSLRFHAERASVSVRGGAAAEGSWQARGRRPLRVRRDRVRPRRRPRPAPGGRARRAARPRRARLLRRRLADAVAALRVARERELIRWILILGGTLFVGRHLVESAQARGHEVTLFNRGQTAPDLYPEVETLHGDRAAGDLEAFERELGRRRRHVGARAALGARRRRCSPTASRTTRSCRAAPSTRTRRSPAPTSPRRCMRSKTRRPRRSRARRYTAASRCSASASSACPPGPIALRPRRADRRPARHERALHVLGAPNRARRRRARAGAARPAGAADPRRDLADWLLDMAEKGEAGSSTRPGRNGR